MKKKGDDKGLREGTEERPPSDSDLDTDTSIDIEIVHLIQSLSFHYRHSSQFVMHQHNSGRT